ncbi:cell division protein [Adhaeribacter arboris]|uniref:Cell division protein n=1 Tax=Adhaeribacter arboris TaxID=2072846 RepID=A0A2T2YLM3_9BACT|nr:SRPBCC family protein [Adhaeribacter arboris]PSR56389.1 cell division protein [Adhaeribacter arboris]
MPVIHLRTFIRAPQAVCFDLSRSIDLHIISMKHTGEKAMAGRTSGLIELNETVTWQAKHLGIWQTLTTKITDFSRLNFFADEMVTGAFQSFRHEHYFTATENGTTMTDIFRFTFPLGWLGNLANVLFLTRYMRKLLEKRNQVLKDFAESKPSIA